MTANEPRASSESGGRISRRKLLAMSAATAAGGVAGCMGGGGDGDNPGNESNGSNPGGGNQTQGGGGSGGEETTLDTPMAEITSEPNLNGFAGQAFPHTVSNFIYDKTLKPIQDGTIQPYVLNEFRMPDATTEVFDMKEGFVWWNGEPVKAEDWATSLKISQVLDGEGSPYEEITVPDEYTVEATRKSPVNPTLRRMMYAGRDVSTYRGKYGEWLTKLEEATSREEVSSVQKNLQEMTITYEDAMNDGLGNAPYRISKVENQRLVFTPFEDHPWAGDLQIDEVAFTYSDQAGQRQKIINDEYDLQTQTLFPQNLRSQAPDYLQNISEYGALWMWTLKTNWLTNDALATRGVRRAMAAALNLNNIKKANSNNGVPVETQTGMDPSFSESWLGDEYGQLHSYAVGEDYGAADQFLADTDYSRQNGQVVGPDGQNVKLNFIAQTGSPRNVVAKAVSSQLQEYGFNVEFQALSRNQFVNTYYDSMQDWDLCVESHFGGSYFHPLAYYNVDHMFGMLITHYESGQEQIQQWIEEGKENSPYNGKPLTPEIPSEPGVLEISDGGETLNLYESNVVLTESQSEEETTEMTKKLARFWNYDLPDIDLIQRVNGSWGDTQNYSWPEKSAPSMNTYRGPYYAIKKGQVGYK